MLLFAFGHSAHATAVLQQIQVQPDLGPAGGLYEPGPSPPPPPPGCCWVGGIYAEMMYLLLTNAVNLPKAAVFSWRNVHKS